MNTRRRSSWRPTAWSRPASPTRWSRCAMGKFKRSPVPSMSRFRLFYRLIVRPFHREPLRTSLVVLAVALGVAVVLAIELAGDAAAGSFRSSIETLTGNADLEVSAVGGVPDEVVGRLATLPYPITVRPRIEDYAVVAATRQTVPLIGLDMIADHPGEIGSAQTSAENDGDVQQFTNEDSVWV